MVSFADRTADFIENILEYEKPITNGNLMREDTDGVNQEKLAIR
ncbi:MAG: hypothetical protein ACLRFJ_00795 [Alphaproteobacteria bacterium]